LAAAARNVNFHRHPTCCRSATAAAADSAEKSAAAHPTGKRERVKMDEKDKCENFMLNSGQNIDVGGRNVMLAEHVDEIINFYILDENA
jgi:hypothetical protein